jgi:PIN domain nuclease of toxin-antitoxin system
MQLLLDTHIWIWSLIETSRLSGRVARELENPNNEIWLSPISTWELLTLAQKGHLGLGSDPYGWIREALAKTNPREATITHEVAIQSRLLDLPAQDPVDRFLAATAFVYDLTLVTADERLLKSRHYSVLANK